MNYPHPSDYRGAPGRPAQPIDAILDAHRRFIRCLHFSRASYASPWLDLPLTLPQMRVLMILAGQPEGLSGRDLAQLLGVGPSAVTPLVDRLVELGYVRRDEDRLDRRVTRLSPTAEGMALLERLAAGQRERLAAALAHLTPDQLQVVLEAFELLNQALTRVADAAASATSS